MASLTVHEAGHTITNADHTATSTTTTDLQPYSQDKKHVVTNINAIGTQPTDAAEVAEFSTKTDLSTSSTNSAGKISPKTPENPDPEVASTTIQSTTPVPVVYPPRRPNIFMTRQKHVRFPVSGLSAVAPRTVSVGTTTQEPEAADGFSMANLEEFQAEVKDKMKKKSEMFMNMVRQSAWKQRRVEDSGEIFEIEG